MRFTRTAAALALVVGVSLGVVGGGCSAERELGPASVVELPAAPGPEHVFLLEPGLYSGAAPEDAADYDALAALGIRTELSVDAATPRVALAAERGIRVVHVPIEYDGACPEARARIIRVLRDLPRPIYVHCHHGRHRGPAAAAFGLVALGRWTPAQGASALEALGTSPAYEGLYRLVAGASLPPEEELEAVRDEDLVAVAEVPSLAALMAAIDRALDRVSVSSAAGWRSVREHPDLAPLADAGALTDLLRRIEANADVPASARSDFDAEAQHAVAHAARVESALLAAALDEADAALRQLHRSCRACHDRHR